MHFASQEKIESGAVPLPEPGHRHAGAGGALPRRRFHLARLQDGSEITRATLDGKY